MLPADALDYVLKVTGYLKNLETQKTIEAQNRVENIEELINAVIEYEQNAPRTDPFRLLENVALTADIDSMETDSTDSGYIDDFAQCERFGVSVCFHRRCGRGVSPASTFT